MARTLTRSSQSYPAGNYGPFNIDSFTSANTNRIEVVFTNVSNWPTTAGPMFTLQIRDGAGGGGDVVVTGADVAAMKSDGHTQLVVGSVVGRVGSGKAQVTSASISMTSHRAFTTAITVRAV